MKNDFMKVVFQIHALIKIASEHCRQSDSMIMSNRHQNRLGYYFLDIVCNPTV